MNTKTLTFLAIAACLLSSQAALSGTSFSETEKVDFSTNRTAGEKQYRFETSYIGYAQDGTRLSEEAVIMECDVSIDRDGTQQLTCLEFSLKDKEGVVRSIPKLRGWQNVIDGNASEVLGVPHADFQGLVTEDGNPVAPDISYRVYNTFIDFYAFNNVFGQPNPSDEGKGIEDLTTMGEEILLYSAFSAPPVNLGDAVKEGSYFKNGRVTLQWDGVGEVEHQPCAMVAFDSGESSFFMLMEPMPNISMRVKGGSNYWGNLYVNLDDYWVEKATFREFVTTEMVFGENPPISSIVKRIGTISLMD